MTPQPVEKCVTEKLFFCYVMPKSRKAGHAQIAILKPFCSEKKPNLSKTSLGHPTFTNMASQSRVLPVLLAAACCAAFLRSWTSSGEMTFVAPQQSVHLGCKGLSSGALAAGDVPAGDVPVVLQAHGSGDKAFAGFPRGGAYSGRPNRFNFNRFAVLQESMENEENEENENDDSEAQCGDEGDFTRELTNEEVTQALDSIEACSEIPSDDDWEDSLLDEAEWENLMTTVPWALGGGFSYYQKELFGELFFPCLAECEEEFNDVLSVHSTSESDFFDIHDEQSFLEEEDIIQAFLTGFPRGGAGGSAATTRKRQINQLAEMLQSWGEAFAETQPDGDIQPFINEIKNMIETWEASPPTRASVCQQLAQVLKKMQADSEADFQEAPQQSSAVGQVGGKKGKAGGSYLHQQSFYDALRQRSDHIGKGKKGPKKNNGKGKGVDDIPKFVVKRAFPGKSLCSWQNANRALEAAEAPPTSLVQCRDAAQIILFQDMTKIAGLTQEIILFAPSLDNDPDIPGASKVLLPYFGNIALREAWIAMASGDKPSLGGISPLKRDVKAPQLKETATVRVTAALDFIPSPLKNDIIKDPSTALGIAGIQKFIKEARCFRWSTSINRMVQGYISFGKEHLEEILQSSGTGGIFFSKLAIHQSQPLDIEWIPVIEHELPAAYLERALAKAKDDSLYLTWRKGGGACLGLVHGKAIDKLRHWHLFGIEKIYGPIAVQELLETLDWVIPYRPSEPKGRNGPWQFYGKPKTHSETLEFNYQIEGEKGTQFLRIVPHYRKKKEETQPISCRHQWWEPTTRFESKIADTVMEVDSQDTISPTKKDTQSQEKVSPIKKKARKTSIDTAQPGPGGWPIRDLGGSGDCGWRCIAFGLAGANTKFWSGSIEEENKFVEKIREVGAMLRTQTTHDLLNSTDWHDSWAADPNATRLTEDGAVPSSLDEFKKCLARPNRWICGLSITRVSRLKHINIVIFELKEQVWKRTGLVLARENSPEKLKTTVMILDQGHYFAVKALQVPTTWLNPEGVLWCSKGYRQNSFFTRGGVVHPCTPVKRSRSLEALLRSCTSSKNDATCSASPMADEDFQALLRSCSSRKQYEELRTASTKKPMSLTGDWTGCRVCSHGDLPSNSHKIVKDKGTVKSKIIKWSCVVCGFQLEGTYQAIQCKLIYHIREVHSGYYQATLQKRRQEGFRQSGLCVRSLALPRPFVRSSRDAIFRCPWCNLFLSGPLSLKISKKSRKQHLLTCKKKPKNKECTPLQFNWLSRRVHRDFWRNKLQKACHKQLANRAEKAYNRAKERGHDIVKTDIRTLSKSRRALTWVCKICLSPSGGASGTFYKRCPGKIICKSPALWYRAQQMKILQKTMDTVGMDKQKQKTVRQWIREITFKKNADE